MSEQSRSYGYGYGAMRCIALTVLYVVALLSTAASAYTRYGQLVDYVFALVIGYYAVAGIRRLFRKNYRPALCLLLPILVLTSLVQIAPRGRLKEIGFRAKLAATQNYGHGCQADASRAPDSPVRLCEEIVYLASLLENDRVLAIVYDGSDGLADPANCNALERRVPESEQLHFPWLGVVNNTPFTCRRILGHYFGVKGPDWQ